MRSYARDEYGANHAVPPLAIVCFLLLVAEITLFGAIVMPMPFVMKKK